MIDCFNFLRHLTCVSAYVVSRRWLRIACYKVANANAFCCSCEENSYYSNICNDVDLCTDYMSERVTMVCQWLCGRVVDLQLGGCRFESRPGLLRTKVYSAFHPSGIGK